MILLKKIKKEKKKKKILKWKIGKKME